MKNILKNLTKVSLFFFILLIIIFSADKKAYCIQDTITLPSYFDNTLYEDAGGMISNGRGKYMFAGKSNTGLIRRALLNFLAIEFFPPCTKVLSVNLKLHLAGGNPENKTIEVRKVLERWGQGNSNAPGLEEDGTAASSYDATWLHRYYNTDLWSSPGGVYSGIVSTSATVGGPGYYNFNSTPELVADFQSWLDNPSDEFGWILIGDETSDSTAKRFHTADADTIEFQPEVTVIYETAVFNFYLESLIEGFWNGSEMVEDVMTVKLHSPVSPYNVVDSASAIVGTWGGQFCFFNAPPGDYYVSVHHRNTIETWSSVPVTFSLNGFEYYSFKDDAATAYGSNQVFKLAKYCFYGGDVDQNGFVDATDLVSVFNDANLFTTGYVPTDLTGDDLVDVTDVLIAFNNSNNFVSVIKP
ncbi:MAG TPA: DNRLRE domain-containing protein [Ignavibacteria bacterium]|nr:DNRLRE domain-containing protein [Ignavibacteria bacterium]HMR40341.1 DNRLRE domain-containing protein [Ignavibacteria bacterium]